MKRITEFARRHAEGAPISMVTCYDAWSARLIAGTEVDAVLVGDSVAMVVHGFPSTVYATVEMMALHTAAVRRGIGGRLVIADLPFPLHRMGVEAAMKAVDALMKAGAQAIKIEGAEGNLDLIRHIVGSGVPVMGHLGLMPQSVNQIGGYKVQGREETAAVKILSDAQQLEQSGCFGVVLECVPSGLAARVTEKLAIPTIGIGSGVDCSGQILVLQDMLGMDEEFKPKFLRKFAEGAEVVKAALEAYDKAVKARSYPRPDESFEG